MSDIFPEVMKAKDEALKNSKKIILGIWDEWEKMFGRRYRPVETYCADDADVILLTMGSMGETAEIGINELRKKGISAGLVKLRLWRPFPFEELKQAVKKAKILVVTDRAVSFGGPGGPVASEVRAALYAEKERPLIYNQIIGLGGRDMAVSDFVAMVEDAVKSGEKGIIKDYEFYGVRG